MSGYSVMQKICKLVIWTWLLRDCYTVRVNAGEVPAHVQEGEDNDRR